MVEHQLPKLRVASSILVTRSSITINGQKKSLLMKQEFFYFLR